MKAARFLIFSLLICFSFGLRAQGPDDVVVPGNPPTDPISADPSQPPTADPVDPTQPNDPIEPTNPLDPNNPIDPIDPIVPHRANKRFKTYADAPKPKATQIRVTTFSNIDTIRLDFPFGTFKVEKKELKVSQPTHPNQKTLHINYVISRITNSSDANVALKGDQDLAEVTIVEAQPEFLARWKALLDGLPENGATSEFEENFNVEDFLKLPMVKQENGVTNSLSPAQKRPRPGELLVLAAGFGLTQFFAYVIPHSLREWMTRGALLGIVGAGYVYHNSRRNYESKVLKQGFQVTTRAFYRVATAVALGGGCLFAITKWWL